MTRVRVLLLRGVVVRVVRVQVRRVRAGRVVAVRPLRRRDGDLVLVDAGPTTEHKRIVEWMDGDGVVHQENAQITVSITS